MTETNETSNSNIPGAAAIVRPGPVMHLIAPYHHHEVNNLPLECGKRERDVCPPDELWSPAEPLADVITASDHNHGYFTIGDVLDQVCPGCVMALIRQREEVAAMGGKPSKGTPKDGRLKENKPQPITTGGRKK